MESLSSLSVGETALDRTKKKFYKSGYNDGVVAGELQAMARIKQQIHNYIAKYQKLWDETDGEEGINYDNCDLEDDLMKIVMGEK